MARARQSQTARPGVVRGCGEAERDADQDDGGRLGTAAQIGFQRRGIA